MPIEFYAGGSARGGKFVTVDRQKRLCLSADLRRELGCFGIPAKFYVGYDSANKRIAIAKPDIVRLTDKKPLSFSADRGYASASGFLATYNIPCDKSYRYVYVGMENGAHTFELESYDAPDAEFQPEIKESKRGRPRKETV